MTAALDDRFRLEGEPVLITGVQALVRTLLDHQRAEQRDGRRTATFVSGYPGSPLGGFDRELARHRHLLAELDIVHTPGLNEDLAATAVWGSQLAGTLPQARFEGVLGVWYGKSPGLDRSGDAIRHANMSGTGRLDGVVAFVGDDPTSKSSTVPSASESALAELGMPVLYPGDVQEVLDLGAHAIACSRATGLWTAVKVIVDVADAAGTVVVDADRVAPVLPTVDGKRYVHRAHRKILAPDSLALERSLLDVRLELARRYAHDNGLNRVTAATRDDWLGVTAAGKTYRDLREALDQLGIGDRELARLGVRLFKVGMVHPLDPTSLAAFADGLNTILVLEDKKRFLEMHVRDLLFDRPGRPRVVGRREAPLPSGGELDPATIAAAIVGLLGERDLAEPFEERARRLRDLAGRRPAAVQERTPFYCSGCPHNRSTQAPDDTLVGVGVGCHTMVLVTPEGKGNVTGMTQMGGEGAQWIGMAPFTGKEHFVQNVGDGTFFHSGSLALRWAVSAGVNVTYKLLYNDAIAMTGGQSVQGGLGVPALTRMLEAEGVAKTVITTEHTSRYRGVDLAGTAEVRPREDFQSVETELAATPGVTVLVHDQQCAAEKRRLRKRGRLATPDVTVAINEPVCEACGDCGRKSNCLSVVPVDTEFGRKTQIHEPSCNKDLTCLEGDCPSFITIRGARPRERGAAPRPPARFPEPSRPAAARIRMAGIGGTGVVTISQVLGMAASLEGSHVSSLDQTGLAQKGGAVVSDIHVSTEPIDGANKAPPGAVDLYLAFDLVSAATARNLLGCDPQRTRAVVSTSIAPTGEMITDTWRAAPDANALAASVDAFTRAADNIRIDAEALAHSLFGDHMQANAIVLGAAYQLGALPVGAGALEKAIRLNGVAVDDNLAAFAWGRATVAAPAEVERATRPPREDAEPAIAPEATALVERMGVNGDLGRLLAIRASDLIGYQDRSYAGRYLEYVAQVRTIEQARLSPESTVLTTAVARNLHKLMAYKDEYEVARLHLDPAQRAALRSRVGDDAKIAWRLHPPILRALGFKRKLAVGEWFVPVFRLLRALRRLRGTPFDAFGWMHVRRVERALIGEYQGAVLQALDALSDATRPQVEEVCELPDLVRGYEGVKLANVERFRARLTELQASLPSAG